MTTRTLRLKDKYKINKADKIRIGELDQMFFDNDHELLHGKRLPAKYKREIEALYFKYLCPMNNIDWSRNILDVELDSFKHDPFCKGNSNKKHWLICYLLSHMSDLKDDPTIEDMFYTVIGKEAYQLMTKYAYELV